MFDEKSFRIHKSPFSLLFETFSKDQHEKLTGRLCLSESWKARKESTLSSKLWFSAREKSLRQFEIISSEVKSTLNSLHKIDTKS